MESTRATTPATGEPGCEPVPHTAPDELDRLAKAAAAAVPALATLPGRVALEARADRLCMIAPDWRTLATSWWRLPTPRRRSGRCG
jgi:hypothetical protein